MRFWRWRRRQSGPTGLRTLCTRQPATHTTSSQATWWTTTKTSKQGNRRRRPAPRGRGVAPPPWRVRSGPPAATTPQEEEGRPQGQDEWKPQRLTPLAAGRPVLPSRQGVTTAAADAAGLAIASSTSRQLYHAEHGQKQSQKNIFRSKQFYCRYCCNRNIVKKNPKNTCWAAFRPIK